MLYFLTSVLAISAAFAQTPHSASSNTDPFAVANREWKAVEAEIEQLSQKGAGYQPCEMEYLKFLEQYYGWFEQRQDKVKALLTQLNSDVRNQYLQANARLQRVRELTISLNPVKGQTAAVQVNLKQVADYFKLLKARMQSLNASELDALMRQQEDPRLNPLKVSHSQIMNALKLFTDDLNSSLKEEGGTYSVSWSDKNNDFKFIFSFTFTFNGRSTTVDVDLTDNPDRAIDFDQMNQWAFVIQNQPRLDGFALDGNIRYYQMASLFLQSGTSCPKNAEIGSNLESVKSAGLPVLDRESIHHSKASVNTNTSAWLKLSSTLQRGVEPALKFNAIGMDGNQLIASTASGQYFKIVGNQLTPASVTVPSNRAHHNGSDYVLVQPDWQKPFVRKFQNGVMVEQFCNLRDLGNGKSDSAMLVVSAEDDVFILTQRKVYHCTKGAEPALIQGNFEQLIQTDDGKILARQDHHWIDLSKSRSDTGMELNISESRHFSVTRDDVVERINESWFSVNSGFYIKPEIITIAGSQSTPVYGLSADGELYQLSE